jgi:cell division protein FtsQ
VRGTVVAEARQRQDKGWQVAIDPRFAARRKEVRRRSSRTKHLVVGTAALLSLLAAGAWPVLHSRLFSARVLSVVGAGHTGTAAVLRVAGLSDHPPMIDVHAGAAAAAIEALPWVQRATVSLEWPDGVRVRVTERSAVALVADGSRYAEVDRTGRVLAVLDSAPAGLVRLSVTEVPGVPGSTLRTGRAALAVAAALPPVLRPLVTTVADGPDGGVDLALSDGVGVVFGTPTQLPAKFEDVASLVAGAHLGTGSVLDVSVPAFPALTPPKAATGPTPSG